ncbi:MAG: tyrosine-type recombinase/integrase [Bacteroidales bacterium]|nr:tyrosine-type recombinase/integrase [Bacteroidales bacterium]
MKQPTDFAKYISGFLYNYLTNERGVSKNTIKSYSYTFILFVNFMHEVKKIHINRLSLKDITKEVVVEFLDWIQSNRKCCDSTRNQRLAAISSFIKYVEYMDPAALYKYHQILSIPIKKTERKLIRYLPFDGVKLLLQQPNVVKGKGLRDLTLLSLMYESAARVQEIIDLTPSSLYLDSKPYRVILHGKGNKHRPVPLPEEVVQILKRYMNQYELFNRENAQKPLFPNNQGQKMTRNGVNNILRKYVKMAKEKDVMLIPDGLSCHSLRHSKAMQLLESRVKLIYIRDFLGHKSVITTEIYARVNPRYTFEAVKNAYKNITTDEIPVWEGNNELIAMLKEFAK